MAIGATTQESINNSMRPLGLAESNTRLRRRKFPAVLACLIGLYCLFSCLFNFYTGIAFLISIIGFPFGIYAREESRSFLGLVGAFCCMFTLLWPFILYLLMGFMQ